MNRIKKFYKENTEIIWFAAGGVFATAVCNATLAMAIKGYTVEAGTHMVGDGRDEIVLHFRNGQKGLVPGRHIL